MGRFDDRDKQIELRQPKVMIYFILCAIILNLVFGLIFLFEIIETPFDTHEIITIINFFFVGWGTYLLQKEIKKYLRIKNGKRR